MLNRLPFLRRDHPSPPPQSVADPVSDLRTRLLAQIERLLILRFPVIVPLRTVYADLRESNFSLILMVPLLLWVGWRTYRRERREVLRRRERR